jgi:hypothetical protein
MRVRRLPEVLMVAGLAGVLGVGTALLVERGGSGRSPQPASGTTSSTTTVAPPPPAGPAPFDVQVVELQPFSAVLSWRTASPTIGQVAVGTPLLGPVRAIRATPPSRRHAVPLERLSFGHTFRAWITSTDGEGNSAGATVDLSPPAPSTPLSAAAAGGSIRLDGKPWFPFMAWGQCSTFYDSGLAAGITLFAHNPCGGLEEQLRGLGGRALSAGADGDEGADGQVVGAFYPDEADAHGVVGAALAPPSSGLAFLTLPNHFYSGAAALPQGRDMYPGLISRADVVGFDLYPLQEWCEPDRLADVEAAQRELVVLAAGKPTFQWIEASGMKCPNAPRVEITPATVRAESWLAIIGGAHGLGFFPASWTGDVETAIRRVGDEVGVLAPALLSHAVPVEVDPSAPVRASSWTGPGSVLVAAVNTSRAAVRATLRAPGLDGRTFGVVGESRRIVSTDESLSDEFGPLAVHLYVAPRQSVAPDP